MKTLAGYRELDHDKIQSGYIDWLLSDNGLMARLKIKDGTGNGLKYNVRTARGNAAWVQPNETIETTTGTTTQRSAAVYELVKQADVSKFAIATNSTQDPAIAELKESADDMKYEWSRAMIWGQSSTVGVTNEPKGLALLIGELESTSTVDLDGIENSQVIPAHATSEAITLDDMLELTDAVKLGVDCYAMTRRARRKITSLATAAGNNLTHDKDELGYMCTMYGGKPIYIVDTIGDNVQDGSSSVLTIGSYASATTRASGYDNFLVFALNTSDEGFVILQAQAMKKEGPWTPDNKNSDRYRFTWYTGFALLNKYAAAVLINGLDTALS